MRLRRRNKRMTLEEKAIPDREIKSSIKATVLGKPMSKIRKLLSNHDFNIQLLTVLLTMTSDNVRMGRRIETVTSSVDKVRSLTELINNTMTSLKIAVEAPRQIKRLLK